MENIGYIAAMIATSLIRVMQLAMLIRAILSWFPVPQALSGFYRVLYLVTEPLIAPFRKLLYHSRMIQSLPIDISFLLAYLALGIIQRLFWMLMV